MIRKLHFGAIISFLTFLLMVGVMASGVVYGAPQYPDTLSAYSALEKQMWNAGCRRTEPEVAEPIDTKVYKSATGTISGIINLKLRSKCILYPIAAPTRPAGEVKDQTVTVEWNAPTARTNGYPLAPTEIAGYHVYLDGVKLDETSDLTLQFTAPLSGRHRVQVKTIDVYGLESDLSAAWEFSI